jgi:integrase
MSGLTLASNYDIDSIIDSLDVSENTRYEYRQRVRPFLALVQAEGLSLNVILEYKRRLAERSDYSVSTKNKYLVCAKLFMRECYRLGLIERDITVNVKSFKQSKKHKVNGLTDEEVSLIGEWIMQHPEKLRERSLLCLAILQGLRQFEICNIKLRDIDFAAGTLMVLGKGRDDYERVYLHPKTARALRRYCQSRKLTADDYLFVSKRKPSSTGKLTTRGLQSIIKGIFDELGIDRTVHGCRHYFASRLIQAMPGELATVARFTRHKSLETLEIYDDNRLMLRDVEHYRKAFDDLKI